jgi:hypothetical protein
MIVFEEFSNNGCPGCPGADAALDEINQSYAGRVIAIRYHVSWPNDEDPMNRHNPVEVRARKKTYKIGFVPVGLCNGGYPSDDWWSDIEKHLNADITIQFRLNGIRMQKQSSIAIQLSVPSGWQAPDCGLLLHCFVCEDRLVYQNITYNNIFRKAFSSVKGEPIVFNDSGIFETTCQIKHKTDWIIDNCYLAVFAQENCERGRILGSTMLRFNQMDTL